MEDIVHQNVVFLFARFKYGKIRLFPPNLEAFVLKNQKKTYSQLWEVQINKFYEKYQGVSKI